MSSNQLFDARKELESFLINNTDLEELEAMIAEFNIFEAIGMIHQEVKHSQFLALLLNPNGNHGLDDLFLKRLLMIALRGVETSPITPLDLDLMELSNAEVQREWNNIDILITDPVNRFVCIIENKVLTGEHDDQLQRYRSTIDQQYSGWSVVGLYLTPDGSLPSDETFIPISYVQVAEVLDGLLKSQVSMMGSDIRTIITHYITMLRRHIVTDSEIADLCRRIYARHQRALDLIFEHRPDLQSQIAEYVVELTQSQSSMKVYGKAKTEIRFRPIAWDGVPLLMMGTELRYDGRGVLMFAWAIGPEKVDLRLYIGPGPQEIRKQLFDLARETSHEKVFEPSRKNLRAMWNTIYNHHVLRSTDFTDADLDNLKSKIEEHWKGFIKKDLPHFNAFVDEIASQIT